MAIFWATVVLVAITAAATAINYLLFRSQVDPNVVVYVTADDRRPSIVNLVIENIGKGVAKNVRFVSSHPLPAKAFGFTNPPPAPRMTSGPLVTGIPSLGPGVRRVITWGQFGGLHKAIGDATITITAHYSSDARSPWDPRELVTESFVDIKSLEGTDISDHNYDRMSAKHLEKIARSVEHLTLGSRALKTDVAHLSHPEDVTAIDDDGSVDRAPGAT